MRIQVPGNSGSSSPSSQNTQSSESFYSIIDSLETQSNNSLPEPSILQVNLVDMDITMEQASSSNEQTTSLSPDDLRRLTILLNAIKNAPKETQNFLDDLIEGRDSVLPTRNRDYQEASSDKLFKKSEIQKKNRKEK
ncbi:hypothetical protein GcM3_217039 [Golovinomyces cichoracearum]|uniref:Uncharacterized protein n=1 Tax=Golovinomyces cichoracearum TaxID=62708 RepID=A0A420H877_9PEZI|nr:hypothetical protein GcM3_217039 [Golovinomyces cichoracearum]